MRLGAIPGATPDKWVTRWRERYPDFALSVDRFDEAGQLERLRAGTVDVGYIRFREDTQAPTGEDLHRVWLYREAPVVCASRDHWVAAAETSVTWEEIAAEPFFDPAEMLQDAQSADPEQTTAAEDVHTPKQGTDLAVGERMALEVVASGAGLVVLPNSVARMFARRDIVIREIEGIPGYDVGLAWLREVDSPVIQEFIGVARGRKPGSGRSEISSGVESKATSKSGAKPESKQKPNPKRAAAGAAPGRSRPGQKPGSRRGQPPRGRRRPR
ncbi:LysR family substrate-binding domain-containing protein [Nesterenkonia sp. E16_7]|uniref:LysR family substrate-binding domain-containing protein n=1 Tax=unclassified Nesterenkonia TaxID=2629769 RepID=UPI001A913352|nr:MULTISPECIES: LysR family substrate-binding domain-containing protein [unclassified Nesterenkonia]MBO0595521.1 LysR family substrate-binding domain-containing protein [Nesterenkonia sp. E16_10]MBO0599033.1 LysR family substrate-binding domain-containing protein [Nesterenkonia sp. E16_7]